MQSRISNRVKQNEAEDCRRKSIQNFYEERRKSQEEEKRQEVEALMRKSQQRHRQLDLLISRNSRVRENKASLDASSVSVRSARSARSAKSMKNPEETTILAETVQAE